MPLSERLLLIILGNIKFSFCLLGVFFSSLFICDSISDQGSRLLSFWEVLLSVDANILLIHDVFDKARVDGVLKDFLGGFWEVFERLRGFLIHFLIDRLVDF